MPFVKKVANPIGELPPLEKLLALIAALEVYAKNEFARLALERLHSAEKLYRKELAHLFHQQEQDAQHPVPKLDLSGMEKAVKGSIKALEVLLVRLDASATVEQVHRDHSGTVPVAEALLKEVGKLSDEAVTGVAAMLRKDLKRFQEAQARVDTGGHAAFDDATTKHARTIWRALDSGKAVLGICLLDEGRVWDPVLADWPTTVSSLRPVLATRDPNAPSPKPAKGAKKAGKGKKPNDGSSNGASGTGTDGQAPTK